MPTYQYACNTCGNEFEIVQKFSDDALTECPSCSGQLRKVFSAVGIVFKGSGFYRTDSRSSSTSTVGSAGSSSSSGSSGSSDSSASSSSSGSSGSSSSSGESKPSGSSSESKSKASASASSSAPAA